MTSPRRLGLALARGPPLASQHGLPLENRFILCLIVGLVVFGLNIEISLFCVRAARFFAQLMRVGTVLSMVCGVVG